MKNIYIYLICAFVNIADTIEPGLTLLDSRIIGGASTTIPYKRYMASLRMKVKHFCCGFMISRRIVMSTGSCAYYMKSHSEPDYIDATVFMENGYTSNTYLGKAVNVDHAMYHQDYNPDDPIGTGSYDIGYILLKRQLSNIGSLGIIRLSPNDVQYNETYEMYGWGSGEFENPNNELWNVAMSSSLKKLGIKITERDVCQKLLERDLRPNQICGIGIREGGTAAQGDVGSPLIRRQRFYGITSIVNIKASQGATVFIGAKPLEEYIDDLQTRFPEDDKCEFPGTNKKKSKTSGVPVNKKVRIDRADELKGIFTFGRDTNGVKYGICIKCTELKGFDRIIRMQDSNTSGIRNHLKLSHSKLFEKIYSGASLSNTQR